MLCKMCKNPVNGRSDKIFCSISCKNEYHVILRRVTRKTLGNVDKILHRNRSILLEVMGKRTTQTRISREVLDKKKFNYDYCTGYFVNKKGLTFHYVYDFRWAIYSDKEIIIYKNKSLKTKFLFADQTI